VVNPETAAVCGILAGLVSAVDAVPYVRDIVRGRTRPYRATWAIWTVLGVTAFLAQAADGADWSLLMVGVQAASIVMVFALSIGRGTGRVGPVDLALIAVAAAGLIGWYVSDRSLLATIGVVLADLAGVLLMLPKTWRDPESETPSSFLLAGVSGLLATAAVGEVHPALLYPAYFGVANTAIALVIIGRRRALRRMQARPSPGLTPTFGRH
jgi:hypothetical protein